MGALPKRKISHHRRGGRRSHQALKPRQMVACPQCGAMTLPHSVCPSCGTYKGAQVVEIKEEKKKE
jgi:large subunit ribosomal protein L32